MKKIFAFCLSVILLAWFFCGCGGKSTAVVPITKGISFTADIKYYNENYKCKVRISEDESFVGEVVSPEEIKGMKITCSKDKMTAEYGGLSYDFKLSSIPLGGVCTAVYEVFKSTWEDGTEVIEDNQNFYINGETNEYEYKMTVAPTGLPLSLEIPDDSFKVEFSDVTINNLKPPLKSFSDF